MRLRATLILLLLYILAVAGASSVAEEVVGAIADCRFKGQGRRFP